MRRFFPFLIGTLVVLGLGLHFSSDRTVAEAQQSCPVTYSTSLGPSHIHQVGPGQSSDYNGRPIRGQLHCPQGYVATGIGYKGSNMKDPSGHGSFDPLNGGVGNLLKSDSTADITITCMKLESDGMLTNDTGWLNNPNLNANPRFFGTDNCAPGSVMKSLAQKDLDASVGNSDELDGVIADCQQISATGFGQRLPHHPSSDLDTNPRGIAFATCTGNDVVTGIIYDQMDGSSNTDIDSVRPFCAPVTFTQTPNCPASSAASSSIMSSSIASSVASSIPASSSLPASSIASSVASSVSSALPQCRDGIDNDNDGASDYPNDFSCSNPDDNDETFPKAQCQDGVDNDGDGVSDRQDPGCHTDQNPNNDASYNPQDNDEFNAASSARSSSVSSAMPQCRDGVDNDNDGAIDYPSDFSCSNPDDNDETNPKAQCQDGIDNDYDGLIDFPQDPGCTSRQDNDEFNAASSVASSVMSSIASSAVSSVPRTGCIDILKEAFDTQGNPLPFIPQFRFQLDGANPVGNDSNGRARYLNVPAGTHTVTEETPAGWQLLQVTPVNGQIQVIPGQCVTVAFKNRQFLQASSVSSVPVASSIPASSVASSVPSSIMSSSVASSIRSSSVASSVMSSSISSVPTTGCVDILKEAFDPHGNPLGLIPQFVFTIDGGTRVGNDSQGHARYLNVPAGLHTIAEETPSGWQLLQVTPANGQVHVIAGQCATVAFKNKQFFPQASSVSSVITSSVPASSIPMSSSRASSVASSLRSSSLPASSIPSSSRASSVMSYAISSVRSSSASSRFVFNPIQNVNVNTNANTTVNSNINANTLNVVDLRQSGGGIQNANVNASGTTVVNSTINAGALNNVGIQQRQVQRPQQTGNRGWSSWLMQMLGIGMGTGGLLARRWF